MAGIVALCAMGASAAEKPPAPSLDEGFRLLYNLKFAEAHEVFTSWEQLHPNDPMGFASDGAGQLFSEFHRLGVLEGQFFENDKAFEERRKLTPDPAVRDRFNDALAKAEARAEQKLKINPNDRDSLLAMTMSSGLKADYAALIEKRNFASLSLTKQASKWAQQLLAADPTCYDAYLATGMSKYIVGSMSAPARWLLRLGGVDGDKSAGIQELQMTADQGHYLAPFARILLAIAYVRDKDKPKARSLLAALQIQFPGNSLFAYEIARLDSQN